MPDFSYEDSFLDKIVIGTDEAGRGPIAGPVVASCVLIDRNFEWDFINDSKKMTPKKRSQAMEIIKKNAKYGIGIVDSKKIDQINILQASKLAMYKSYQDLIAKYQIKPEILLVDGNFTPFELTDNLQKILPIVKGDQKSISIAAASIIAKETRDKIMSDYHQQFPNYGFNKHMGYPTKAHIANIYKFGIVELHRKTFAPIKDFIEKKIC